MLKIRIRFEKTGNARFISHLDLMRTMCRAMRRAEIPLKFTAGFNPRPHMVFGNPLSLGYESLDEVCDVELNLDSANFEDIKNRLNATLPNGLFVTELYERESKISDIGFAEYKITVTTDKFSADDIKALMSGKSLIVTKKSKSGERETDILPLIAKHSVCESGGKIEIYATVAFSNTASLNPDNISKAIRRYLCEEFDVRYIKLASLDANLKKFL